MAAGAVTFAEQHQIVEVLGLLKPTFCAGPQRAVGSIPATGINATAALARVGAEVDPNRIAVGGRLRNDGTIPVRAGDQFNGMVDRVVYDRR